MDGLECSEVSFTKLSGELRYDSEYYQKQYIFEDVTLMRYKKEMIGNVAFVTDGQHGYHEIDEHSSIHMLTAKNAKNWFANLQGAEPLAKWVDDNNKRSSLEEGDIILSTRGTVGNCAIVMADILPANIDQDVARIKLITTTFEKEFVITYLNSIYGQDWMKRNQTGMVQQGLSLQKVRMIPIPVLCEDFQTKVKNIVLSAYSAYKQSQSAFIKAEKIILDELGVTDFTPSVKKISVKNFADSFGTSGRLDAEYYQTKYEQIEKALFKPQYVEQCCKLFDTNYTPSEKMEYKYIELSNIGIRGDISNVDTIIGIELPSRARRQVKVDQVIVSSIEGSLNSCAIVTQEYHNALCSTGFYVIESDSINSETLLVLFKSPPIQSLMKKRCSGTILTAISKDEFLHLLLPTISLKIQNEIAIKVQESFLLRKKSKELLERAKQAVEMAIEKDEQTAMDWLSNLK